MTALLSFITEKFTVKYEPIMKDLEGEEENFDPRRQRCDPSQSNSSSNLPWVISTLGFAALSAFLYFRGSPHRNMGAYEIGFRTELGIANSVIELHQLRFTGTPSFHENGTGYHKTNPGEIQYVGPPSPEIDRAWEPLLYGRYVGLTADQAQKMWGDNYNEYYQDNNGLFHAGPNVFHTLHCLNELRKALDSDYYQARVPSKRSGKFEYGRSHHDHCIDQLRQMIQCYGDFTPNPTRWFDAIGQEFVVTDNVHTCRNFDSLRRWTTEKHDLTIPYSPSATG